MYPIVWAFIIIGAGLAITRLMSIGRRPKDLPPGPPTIPVLGNIHLMPARDLHLQLQKWAQEYGPVYSLMLGTKTMVVISSDEIVKDLLDKRSAIYSDRPENYLAGEVLSGGDRVVMMRYGSKWRMIRKNVHNLLNVQKAVSYVGYQDLENKQMLCELVDQPDRFLDSIRRFAMSLTTTMVYGFRTATFDDPRMNELFHTVEEFTIILQSAGGALLESFPVLRRLPDFLSSSKRHARKCREREYALFMGLWNEVKSLDESGKANPCFCVDLHKVQSEEPTMTDSLAGYTAGSMLEAGSDTTSNTMYGFVQAMVLFPEVQKKAQKELDEVVGPDRLPTWDDYAHLPYIRNCIKEATRWMPTAIIGVPHSVLQDDMYNGYRIPQGASIIANAWTINSDPKRHPEPRRFNPDRFEYDTTSLPDAISNPDATKRPTFTFGAGRRICQGMHVAERSLYLGISRLMWGFEISPAKNSNGKDILPDPSKLTQGFVCMPEPYEATIKPRSPERVAVMRKAWEDAQKDLNPSTKQWKQWK